MKTRGRPRSPDILTPRQQEVLLLLRQGLTNEEIAGRLGITLDGAKWHVSEILMRLGVDTRHEAAIWSPASTQRSRFALLLAPIAALHNLKLNALGYAAAGGATLAVAAAIALLAWGVFRSSARQNAADARDNQIAFTTQAREISSLGRTAQVWDVTTYDTAEHRVVHSFEVGAEGDFPTQAVIAGDKIVVNLETRVVEYNRDGSNPRELRHALDGGRILGVGASPDGALLAITEQTRELFDAPANPSATALPYSAITNIAVIDLRSGAEVLALPASDPGFAGYNGQPARVIWRDDGRGFIVEGYCYCDGGASFATILLDKTIVVHDGSWSGTLVAPNARFSIVDTGSLVCGLGGIPVRHSMPLRDLDTNGIVITVQDDVQNVEPVEWSPDGSQLLYRSYTVSSDPSRPECLIEDPGSSRYHVLPTDGSPPFDIASVAEARKRWSGDQAIEYRCRTEVVVQPYCLTPSGQQDNLDVSVGGALVASNQDFRLIPNPLRHVVSTSDDRAARAAPSDLGKIAYVDSGVLWTKQLPNGEPQRVTTEDRISQPKWSPSGQWLMYRTGDELRVVREDGTAARTILPGSSWAPARDAITSGGDDVRIQNADGSGVHELIAARSAVGSTTSFHDLAWSSDGAWLAYVERVISDDPAPKYLSERLMKIRSDGTEPSALYDPGVPAPEGIGVRGWSPDGQQVLFWTFPSFSASAGADGLALLAVNAAGGKPHGFGYTDDGLLTFTTFQSWAASGQLAVTGGSGRATWTHKEIRIVEPSGAYHVVTDGETAATEPAFSPNALLVAYVAMPDAGTGVSGGDAARTALTARKIWLVDALGANNRQLTSDFAYRDEYPQWSVDGTQLLFVRLDEQSKASLWMVKPDRSDLQEVLADFNPSTVQSDAAWFGYYGHISWDNVLDWWRGASGTASTLNSAPTRGSTVADAILTPAPTTYRDNALGLEIAYPFNWSEGAPPIPYASCGSCAVLGPKAGQYPYGMQIFTTDLSPGCAPACFSGNRSLPKASPQTLFVAAHEAQQQEFERQPPQGLTYDTGDYTLYREIWTVIPLADRTLIVTGFFRYGDVDGERSVRRAYANALATMKLPPP